MYNDSLIWIGVSEGKRLGILPKMANRHGFICGATGTGKTITLKVMAEAFSDAGVPVFLADVKGDLAGMIKPGADSADMQKRIESFGLKDLWQYKSYPAEFWDVHGKLGIPIRTTISDFGPMLLSRLLGLNQVQSDILSVAFRIADEENLLLIDIKDLRAMLNHVADNSAKYREEYGNIAKSSVGAIVRSLTALEDQGGDIFFGEPDLDIEDFFKTSTDGRGVINILESQSLIGSPLIYSTFLLWLLAAIYEKLPEVGDADKPKMVFFFDEAHLLFDSAPKALLDKIEQVVKLIRSKGIGVYFITQNPNDIPDGVLSQLSNKVEHGLRAYTPAEQKAVKAAADSFRVNESFDTAKTICELATGEAVVSFLQEDGSPAVCEKASILPPQSLMGTVSDADRDASIAASALNSKYKTMVDNESAYEVLKNKEAEEEKVAAEAKEKELSDKQAAKEAAAMQKAKEKAKAKEEAKALKEKERAEKKARSAVASVAGTTAGTIGRQIGRELGKSGGSFGKTLGGNIGASIMRGIFSNMIRK